MNHKRWNNAAVVNSVADQYLRCVEQNSMHFERPWPCSTLQ